MFPVGAPPNQPNRGSYEIQAGGEFPLPSRGASPTVSPSRTVTRRTSAPGRRREPRTRAPEASCSATQVSVSGVGAPALVRGAHQVASGAIAFRQSDRQSRPVLVNGAVGIVGLVDGRPISVFEATFVDGRIATIDITADPDRAAEMELTYLD